MHKQAVTKISRRNWFLVIFSGMAGQIAWNVNNVWFNTFMSSKINPDPHASPFPGRRYNGAFVVNTFNRDQTGQGEGCPAAEERLG